MTEATLGVISWAFLGGTYTGGTKTDNEENVGVLAELVSTLFPGMIRTSER
jgi:hypothetical protein